MTDNRKSILAKVKALLSKTVENGCTEAEAMTALDKARSMMDAHDVTDTELAFDGEQVTQEHVNRDPDDIRWTMCGGVAKFCDCKVWGSGKDKIVFLGLQSDALFAGWLLDTLERFVKRQSLSFLADMGRAVGGETDLFGAPLDGRSREHKRRSFVYGCINRIAERLHEAARERQRMSGVATGRDLVVVKNALVTDAFRKLNLSLRFARSKGMDADATAFGRGRQAGDRASFGRPVSGNNNGATLSIGKR